MLFKSYLLMEDDVSMTRTYLVSGIRTTSIVGSSFGVVPDLAPSLAKSRLE